MDIYPSGMMIYSVHILALYHACVMLDLRIKQSGKPINLTTSEIDR